MNENNPTLFGSLAKTKRHKRAQVDAARFKVTYDLSEAINTFVEQIASDLQCSQSDVAAHLLAAGLAVYQTGHLNLRAIRKPHTCQLRFAYKLPAPQVATLPTSVAQDAVLQEFDTQEGLR